MIGGNPLVLECPWVGRNQQKSIYSIYQSVEQIPEYLLQRAELERDLFMCKPYLSVVEEQDTNLTPIYVHLKLETNTEVLFVFYETVFSASRLNVFINAQNQLARKVIRGLLCSLNQRLLIAGNVLTTHVQSILFYPSKPPQIDKVLMEALEIARKHTGIKNTLIVNLDRDDMKQLGGLSDANYYLFNTEPSMSVRIHSEWKNFDDYLASFSSKYRVRARKVMKDSADVRLVEVHSENYAQYASSIELLAKNVFERVDFKIADIPEGYFHAMLQQIPAFKLYVYELKGKNIAFVSYFICGKSVDIHYVGLDYEYINSHAIYNRLLLDSANFAIQHQAKILNLGRTAHEIKSTIGAIPTEMIGYIRSENKLMNYIYKSLIKYLKTPTFVVRNPFRTNVEA